MFQKKETKETKVENDISRFIFHDKILHDKNEVDTAKSILNNMLHVINTKKP
jgi:hypothetical protein